MVQPVKIIIFFCIQLIVVNSDDESNKDETKLITYAQILLNNLNNHITYVQDKFVHMKQLPITEVDNFILYNEKFMKLINKLNALAINLAELPSSSIDKKENISAEKNMSSMLQKELDNLGKELDKFSECYDLSPELGVRMNIDEALEKYKKITSEKKKIDKGIEDKEEAQLVDDCVLAIELHRYQDAAEKFNLVKDDNRIKDIVDRIYSEDGSYSLLSFGKKIKTLKRTYLLYKALLKKLHNDEERRSKNISWHFFKYLALLKSAKMQLLEQTAIDHVLKAKAAELLKAIKKDSVQLGTALLTYAVNTNTTLKEHHVSFLRRPLIFDHELVGEICYQTVVENHNQHLDGLKETLNMLFEYLYKEYSGYANDLHLGQSIKYLETKLKNSEYESSLRLNVNEWKEKLSKIVRNILYSEKVCIKRAKTDRYLKQIGDIYTYLVESYRVYIENERFEPQERWQLVHVEGDKYMFTNILHDYSLGVIDNAGDSQEKRTYHQVFTTNHKQDTNFWKIEVVDDCAYFKNAANNEYLFASNELTKSEAATYELTGEFIRAFQWDVVDCTNVPFKSQTPP
uniref:Salivary secreted protein n=1 Tax=Rhodnius prolixus TaxID=13249 RepID=T1HEI0_RHOPR